MVCYNRWLVFPIFDKDKNLSWQARNFNPIEDKWLTQGLARNVVHIIGRVGPIVQQKILLM